MTQAFPFKCGWDCQIRANNGPIQTLPGVSPSEGRVDGEGFISPHYTLTTENLAFRKLAFH